VNTSSAVFEGFLKKVISSANSTWFIKGQSHKRYYMLDLQKLELTQYKTEDDRRNNWV